MRHPRRGSVLVSCDPVSRHWNDVEVVERKGVGHPDTLADGIAELASCLYSQYCLKEFGAVLHHNLDKVAVFGARAKFSWRNGSYDRPLRVIFGGRASQSFNGIAVPLVELLETSAVQFLKASLPGPMPPIEFHHMTTDSSKYQRWYNPQSVGDLPELRHLKANDTAYLTSSAPHSPLEGISLACEAYLRSLTWTGSDIKVMVVGNKDFIDVTICAPVLVGSVSSASDYNECMIGAERSLSAHLQEFFACVPKITINPHCRVLEANADAVAGYVALSGSAIDYGEDGLVGRGNGRTGLIQPNRNHGNEALFGKNPVYHVGKVTGYFSDKIAWGLASRMQSPVRCAISVKNGDLLGDPSLIVITSDTEERDAIQEILDDVLQSHEWWIPLSERRLYVPRLLPVLDKRWTAFSFAPAL